MFLPYANVRIKHWNPGASQPLILPLHLVCNTSDEQIYENIRVNSRARDDWLRLEDAHEGVAVLCGSGPSLASTIPDIVRHRDAGHTIFALNAAAAFLADNGVMPDYQVIIDARPETAQLVGPAKQHLFASQVSPETFARAPAARLWHLEVGGIDEYLPEYERSYCLIGGAASVGNTATCLAYAMGYRNLQLYGYDSSQTAGKSHARHQPMNDGEPCCVVEFNGREYTCSLTMKLQVEKFMETSRHLRQMGVHMEVHGYGLLPDMFHAPKEVLEEAEKYARLWAMDGYREHSPGEQVVAKFLEVARPFGRVIDFGCGTGRAALKIKEAGCDVLLADFTENSRDPEAQALPFIRHDLLWPFPEEAPFGFCTDVLEHIPPEDVELVVLNIMAAAETVFFQISTVPDVMGQAIGQDLHLTVRPFEWWRTLFAKLGFAVLWEEEQPGAALFLISQEARNG